MSIGRESGTGDVVISDPREVRALAHPARITVLHHLYAGEVLTATECAALAGLTPSAMSYHLRSLERAGLIVRADAAADGRERPWRARGTSIRLDHGRSSASRAAEGYLLSQVLGQLRIDLDRSAAPLTPGEAGEAGPGEAGPGEAGPGEAGPGEAGPGEAGPGAPGRPREPGRGEPVRGFTVLPANLTEEQARQLMSELNDLLKRHSPTAPAEPGSRRYHVYWAVLPLGDDAAPTPSGDATAG